MLQERWPVARHLERKMSKSSETAVSARLREYCSRGVQIGLTGAAGAGKTSFGRYVAHTVGLALHKEGVREWLTTEALGMPDTLSDEAVGRLQLYLMQRFEAERDFSLYDRTPIDAVFYAQPAGDLIDVAALRERAFLWMERIDLIVLFPYRSELLMPDGFRDPDAMVQLMAQSGIVALLEEAGCLERVCVFEHHRSYRANLLRMCECLDEMSARQRSGPGRLGQR